MVKRRRRDVKKRDQGRVVRVFKKLGCKQAIGAWRPRTLRALTM